MSENNFDRVERLPNDQRESAPGQVNQSSELVSPVCSEVPRIFTRCPACHNDTLTINKGRLLCTWHECPNPVLIDRLGEPGVSTAYMVKKRDTDGVWCIYMRQWNCVVAEFGKPNKMDAEIIKAILDGVIPQND